MRIAYKLILYINLSILNKTYSNVYKKNCFNLHFFENKYYEFRFKSNCSR